MSLALLMLGRRTLAVRSSWLTAVHFSPLRPATFATGRPPRPSLKPSLAAPFENPFREPTDEKSRRLKLQAHIRFREKFQLENDYQLIYALPKERMYGLMHLVCTCACVTMIVYVLIQFHRDMLDLEPVLTDVNDQIPQAILYAGATLIAAIFSTVLVLIARMPIRLYYSAARQSYALFYHPVIGVFRQKKLLFRHDQYKLVPQKLDSIESAERSIKIRVELGRGLLSAKDSFYLIENMFRSKRDIQRVRLNDVERDREQTQADGSTKQEEADIWETVLEKKEQGNGTQRATQRRTSTR